MSLMTMEQLFKKAGLKNWQNLEINKFYDISNKKLYTNSYNNETCKNEKKLIEALVYKGKAPIYEIVNKNGEVFLKCSGQHKLYDTLSKKYIEVENTESINVLLQTGETLELFVRKTESEQPIVDLKVKDNHNYYTNSILSHNTGGTAVPYYASIICRITKTDDIKDSSGSIGIEMRVRNMKNKCSIPFRDANMHLYFNGGFDSNSEYVDFLLSLGYVTQKGAYFQFDYGGEHFSLQGRQKLLDWLDNHKDVYDNWKKEIKTKLSGFVSELDSNNIAVDEETGEALDEKNSAKIEEYIKETSSKKVTRDETD